ncbi:Scr1 family TA system antitoxin-like transcriptional regulator [Streptomyces sp. NBC_00286]|uniref:Scr1 family TA system antitoxin-like transcriptional regulator n=1 Tax=Streptomyces sp. NBC_00286 TaxID=2975701 RepID=UPI002E2E4E67|nr:Scr1 family TA system antitoxin-like transcriptional regulator [Streptomyces sp. NBC_00286]
MPPNCPRPVCPRAVRWHQPRPGPRPLGRQLVRLMEVSRLPNVTVQVYPFEAGVYAAHSRSFVIFGGDAPELDTVHMEHPTKSLFLWDGGQLDEYAKMFERLSQLALAPVDPESAPESHESRDSLSLIQHVMYTL